jgi:glycosyltransferase involved in cell wall biosynthesis
VRVLLATDHYPPFIGGAHIQSRLLARELLDRGHDVAVATMWQCGHDAVEHDHGVPVHRLRQLRTLPGLARQRRQRHHPPFPDPVTVVAMRRLIARFKPDIVHSFGWIGYSCATALVGLDTPLVLIARDYGYGCANRTLLHDGKDCSGPQLVKCMGCAGRYYGRPRGWIAALSVLGGRALLRRKTSAVHSISEYVGEIMRRDFVKSASRIESRIIHDIIGPESEVSAPAKLERYLRQLPEEPFMLFVGAIRPVKGVNDLLTAYRALENAPPLVLIGTIEADSPASFPAGVVVLEDFPHDAVLAAADRCLFGVMPSLWAEPLGNVVAEVMSRGKPVIGTTPGGHEDMIVDGETGLLVPRRDIRALIDAMSRLSSDAALRERLGIAAGLRAREFAAGVSLPRIEQLYGELLER